MSQGNSKLYTFYDIKNNIFYENVKSLAAFCKEKNLNESCMRDVAKERQAFQHRGFSCLEVQENVKEKLLSRIKEKNSKTKIIKILNKKERYKRTDLYEDFINNVEYFYDKYYVQEQKSCADIGLMLKVDPECIRKHFRINNLKLSSTLDKNNKLKDLIDNTQYYYEELYLNQKKSLKEIAAQLGISKKNVLDAFKKEKLSLLRVNLVKGNAKKLLYFRENVSSIYEEYHVKKKKSCNEIDKIFEIGNSREEFVKLGLDRLNHPTMHSGVEIEILNYFNSISDGDFHSTRNIISPLEIDGYSSKKNLGFEFCGLYWHSEIYKEKNYHLNKLKMCEEKSIRLLTIFENEWILRKEQVKQFIKSTLGIFEKRIYARDCKVREISTDYDFFDKYHIQGIPSGVTRCFGLFFKNELVGCVAYGPHHRDKNKFALKRLAFKANIQIIGGASKLIKNSINELPFDEIITWSDNRWSTGKIYDTCGFKLDGNLPSDYFYFKNSGDLECSSKQSMRKNKINCPSEKTEREWCKENGWLRIYDCGKKRWIFRKENK